MSRHVWFNATWPFPIRVLAERLRRAAFTPESTDGFVVERLRPDELEASYFRKIAIADVGRDPFGREVRDERLTYQQTRFLASSGRLGLELLDAGKGNQIFVSRLLELSDFDLAISPLRVDVVRWAAEIIAGLDSSAYVETIQIGNVDLSSGVTARVVVRGKSEVRSIAQKFVSRPYVVEKLQIRTSDNKRGSILLTNSASAKIVTDDREVAINLTRSKLGGIL